MGLHFRTDKGRTDPRASRSLFEIMNYRLTPEQFSHALSQMKAYRSGVTEYATYAAVTTLINLRLTGLLAWGTKYRAAARSLLRLK